MEVLACPDGGTLVHWAAHFDRRSMLDVLLAHGFSPDAVGARERRPLHYAAASGAEDAFDYLLTKADVTARCNFGTCLHVAAAYGHSAIVYRILKSADRDHLLHEKDHEGRTALHTAAAYRKPVCVRVLLQFFDPNEPDLSGRAPLHLAVARKGELVEDEDILTTLEALFEDPRVDVNVPDKDGNTALASADGRRTVQKALLDRKDLDLAAAISKGGEPAYALAARLGHWAAIRRYLKDNPIPTEADLDGRGNSFVHLLANRNSPMDLLPDRLEDLGIENLNTRNADGRTPLRVAIAHKNWPIADRLLHSEAVSIEDGDAFSLAREILVSADTTRFLEVLGRRYPATLVAKSELGGTILHYTCGHQHDLGIEQLRAAIADRPDLWNEIDRLKRRPVDLLRPSARDRIPDADNAAPWPEPRSWDSGLVWREPEALLREALGEKCSSGDGKYAVSNATRIEVTNLAFYPQEATLLRLTDLGWKEPNLAIYYLAHEKNLFRLDGTSPPIKQINAESISLTSANALEYLRFFCFFVRGDEGPFLIVESAGQYELPAYLNAKDAKRLGELAHPAWYNGFVDETHYASALIYYSNALFGADFRINSAGMIEMIDDFPLANDMSAKIACPIG
jgi:ankyrin repeat protein